MPDPTTNYEWDLPNVGGNNGSWGTLLNDILNDLDTELKAVSDVADAASAAGTAALPKAGGVMTGRLDAMTAAMQVVNKGTINGAQSLDLSLANAFTATINGNTTFTFANAPGDGYGAYGFILRLTNGGNHTVTWPASAKFAGGSDPDLVAGGTDVLVFVTFDFGATWYGAMSVANGQ